MAFSLKAHTNNLIVRFADYVRAFGESPTFNDEQLTAHGNTIELRSRLGLIRFGGHVPKGGYDVQNGINEGRETGATTVQ